VLGKICQLLPVSISVSEIISCLSEKMTLDTPLWHSTTHQTKCLNSYMKECYSRFLKIHIYISNLSSTSRTGAYGVSWLWDLKQLLCFSFWSPLCKKDVDRLKRVQRRATRMIKGLGSLPHEEKLRELFVQPWARRLRGDLITMLQYLKGG